MSRDLKRFPRYAHIRYGTKVIVQVSNNEWEPFGEGQNGSDALTMVWSLNELSDAKFAASEVTK